MYVTLSWIGQQSTYALLTCGSDGSKMHCKKESNWKQSDSLGNILMENIGLSYSNSSCITYLNICKNKNKKNRYNPLYQQSATLVVSILG